MHKKSRSAFLLKEGSAIWRLLMRRARQFDHECSGRREEGIAIEPLGGAPAAHPLLMRAATAMPNPDSITED